jgi:hypothetical protein
MNGRMNAENRGRVTCLIDTQVAWMGVRTGPPHPRVRGASLSSVKGTQHTPIARPSTARVLSVLSARPLSAGGCGLVCPGER